jgi:hypothetical protein
MNPIEIKAFHLVRFPNNGKLSNVEIQNIKIFSLNLYQTDGSYSKFFDKLNLLFGLQLVDKKDIITCYSDQDSYLISFETDKEFMDVVRINNHSKIDIYFCIRNFPHNNQSMKAASNQYIDSTTFYSDIFSKSDVSIPDEKLLNLNVKCDGCKDNIYGYCFKCSSCVNYDLCQSCQEKGVHRGHSFFKLRPWDHLFYGWSCDVCQTTDIKDECFACIDCSKLYFNNLNYFVLCKNCKPGHTVAHAFEHFSAKKIVRRLTNQISEVKNLKLKGFSPQIFNGFSCTFCKNQGVSFKATDLFGNFYALCEMCFLEGMSFQGTNLHSVITSYDAYNLQIKENKLKQQQQLQQAERELDDIKRKNAYESLKRQEKMIRKMKL